MKKTEWKQTVRRSLEGLLIAVTSWLILFTINSRIFNANGFNLPSNVVRGIEAGKEAAISAEDLAEMIAEDKARLREEDEDERLVRLQLEGAQADAAGVRGGVDGRFTNQSWEDRARQLIEANGLNNLNPSDAADFFPNGEVTTDGWINLLGQVIERESSFNPNTTYKEPQLGYNSVGLLQLSEVDAEAKKRGYSEQDLKDPYKNLEVGISILKKTIEKRNCISCGKLKGAAAYWSVLNDSADHRNGKRDQITKALTGR